ncbi:MAG: UPF0280 family protein [Methanobacteriales archaeon]|nr:MAG: hypothetical protein XD44_0643 [Methanobacteriaceae archaeon 41_258]MBC7096844.1 UPF0280 family protein [Methanobacteriales archaeon]MDI3484517.1 uncharacterized protein [Methanobacteriaceae archaeon]
MRDNIKIKETRIKLSTDIEDHGLPAFILKERLLLEDYIRRRPYFLTSLEPLTAEDGPTIVRMMSKAGLIGGVGPMAAVAGTISELSLHHLISKGSKYTIIDNGGDIALINDRKVNIGLYAGDSPLSGEIGFQLKASRKPRGVCTSSGTIGHSISFGRADAVTVFASRASVADALATSIANAADGNKDYEAVENALEKAEGFKNYFHGVLVVVGENAGIIGKIPKLVKTDKKVTIGELWDV